MLNPQCPRNEAERPAGGRRPNPAAEGRRPKPWRRSRGAAPPRPIRRPLAPRHHRLQAHRTEATERRFQLERRVSSANRDPTAAPDLSEGAMTPLEAGPSTGAADNRRDSLTAIEATTTPTRCWRCEAETLRSTTGTRVLRLELFKCSLCFSGEQHTRNHRLADILWGTGSVEEAGSPGA